MPSYIDIPAIAAGVTFTIPLSPNDRFGRNGGKVRVRVVGTPSGTYVNGDVRATVFVGNELVCTNVAVILESAANRGVDNFVPAIAEQVGLPGDPIKIDLRNTAGTARSVHYVVEIDNY